MHITLNIHAAHIHGVHVHTAHIHGVHHGVHTHGTQQKIYSASNQHSVCSTALQAIVRHVPLLLPQETHERALPILGNVKGHKKPNILNRLEVALTWDELRPIKLKLQGLNPHLRID